MVEAACKCVVGTRCKRSGMRWTRAGLDAILANRCLLLNDRWDEHWRPIKAARRSCLPTLENRAPPGFG